MHSPLDLRMIFLSFGSKGKCQYPQLDEQEIWLDGVVALNSQKQRISEAERREVRLRTSIEEVAYSLAGRRMMGNFGGEGSAP